ncbi:MAG: nucleoside hydrolase [Verrucomicrobiales bacterium]
MKKTKKLHPMAWRLMKGASGILPVSFLWGVAAASEASISQTTRTEPMAVIFDTDIGTDIDDVFALVMMHHYQEMGRIDLKAVTTSKENYLVGPFVDLMNHRYGSPDFTIGFGRTERVSITGPYLYHVVERMTGTEYTYPRTVENSYELPTAVTVLRETLAAAEDASITIVSTGYATNLVDLLESPADEISTMTGSELVEAKVLHTVVTAGNFSEAEREYNVGIDQIAAKTMAEQWPVSIDYVPYEVGAELFFPQSAIDEDQAADPDPSPVRDAWNHFFDEPASSKGYMWDPSTVLWALEPNGGYFEASELGTVAVDNVGITTFTEDSEGLHRVISLPEAEETRVLDRFVEFVTAPAVTRPHHQPIYAMTVTFDGVGGDSVTLEQSEDLENWATRWTPTVPASGTLEMLLRNPGVETRVFRVVECD